MKRKLKGFYLLTTSVLIYLFHLPFALAKSATGKVFLRPSSESMTASTSTSHLPSAYDSLQLQMKGLSKQAYDNAKKGFENLLRQGKLKNDSILSIVDFSQESSKKRLFVVDIKNYKVLFNTYVAHGRNSGREMATSFSNAPESFKSSPGFYVTRETYTGKHGYSLKLAGMEKGINDNAYDRAIVMHGAEYVTPILVATQGYIGRSLGCPAVPTQEATPIINKIKNGSCLFIYNPEYVGKSNLLRA